MIERLAFGDGHTFVYDSEEASIHVARYQIAKEYIQDKNVLDIACGEGYGSLLLQSWGAKSVLGVDISQSSIDVANKYFARENVNFLCQNAENIMIEDKFDVIVSFETIEHVKDEISFLKSLKSMLKDNGVIIMSCPNDHWYYKDNESNPFHLRKYTFKEFKTVTTRVFGSKVVFGVGANMFGFANVLLENPDMESIVAKSTRDIINQTSSHGLISKCNVDDVPNQEKCLYYYGIWNYNEIRESKDNLSYNVFITSPMLTRVKNFNDYKISYEKSTNHIEELRQVIQSSEKLVIERDQYIKNLEQKLLQVSGNIQQLEKMVIQRDSYINELEQRLKK